METTLTYTVIKDRKQYLEYIALVDKLIDTEELTEAQEEELDLLTVLIDNYERSVASIGSRHMNPISLIKSLMDDHDLNNNDIGEIMGLSKSLVSEILNYKKRLTLDSVKKLSNKFKIAQEAFSRDYELKTESSSASPASPRRYSSGNRTVRRAKSALKRTGKSKPVKWGGRKK